MSRNFLVADDEFNVSIGTFEEEVFVSGAGLRPQPLFQLQRWFAGDGNLEVFVGLQVLDLDGESDDELFSGDSPPSWIQRTDFPTYTMYT